MPPTASPARVRRAAWGVLLAVLAGCTTGIAEGTPPISPGTPSTPREVNLIARDYSFVPDVLDLVPGETIRLHLINGGLVVHEAVIGASAVQEAWEAAESATIGAPPGPTPVVSVPAEVAGFRIVVESGELAEIILSIPDGAVSVEPWIVGCHIPGHWAKGMQIPVRWVDPSG